MSDYRDKLQLFITLQKQYKVVERAWRNGTEEERAILENMKARILELDQELKEADEAINTPIDSLSGQYKPDRKGFFSYVVGCIIDFFRI